MKLCSDRPEECSPICDFCKYYDFNGDKDGKYTGDGFCNFHLKKSDPDAWCEDYHCFMAEDD